MSMEGFSVVTVTKRMWEIDNIVANYERQHFFRKELVIILNDDAMNIDDIKLRYANKEDIQIAQLPKTTSLGACLNYGYQLTHYDYIAKFDDDDFYGEYYLQESYSAFMQNKCDLVCKANIFYYLHEYQELIVIPRLLNSCILTFHGSGATICMTREAFKCIQYSPLRKGVDLDLFNRCRKQGLSIYSTSSYNFLCNRYESKAHTWNISAERLGNKADLRFGIRKLSLQEAYQLVCKETGL